MDKHIAIIGAGMSGLTAANLLKNYAKITVFDKARGVGGRLAVRRAEKFSFNHGAQYFTASTPSFKNFLKPLITHGVIDAWNPKLAEINNYQITKLVLWQNECPHYFGIPSMNAIAKYLAINLNIILNSKINCVVRNGNSWNITSDKGEFLGNFDWVIYAIPAPQALTIIPSCFAYYTRITNIKMLSCFSLMLGLTKNLTLSFEAAFIKNSSINWMSVNQSQPLKNNNFTIVANTTNQWAQSHLKDNQEIIKEFLCLETCKIVGANIQDIEYVGLQRWLYANVSTQNKHIMVDKKNRIAVCGDWCKSGGVEGAYISGYEISQIIIKNLNL